MKEVWVLSIKTSLPEVCINSSGLECAYTVFESFEKGKKEFRKLIKEFAFSKNAMFDGEGYIIHMKKYADDMMDEEFVDDFECLDKNRLYNVMESLRNAFTGKDFAFEMESEFITDWFIAIESNLNNIHIHGEDDGPCNGVDPLIKTNIFSMNEEKDYFLYIDDMFGQDYSAELYIDLKKAELK
ncbi:MAG: hypothetical protein IKJ93_05775 [Clostridia bacterium]|nr:hypothetical protein [Clostridia bacterium]